MAAGDIETFSRNGIWFNRIQGESHTLGSSFESMEEAVKVGRGAATARQVRHFVRTEEGPSDDVAPNEAHPRDLMW